MWKRHWRWPPGETERAQGAEHVGEACWPCRSGHRAGVMVHGAGGLGTAGRSARDLLPVLRLRPEPHVAGPASVPGRGGNQGLRYCNQRPHGARKDELCRGALVQTQKLKQNKTKSWCRAGRRSRS